MAYAKIRNVDICAVCATVPKNIAHSRDTLSFIDAEEARKIIDVIGIISRRTAYGNVLASDYCVFSATQLLNKLNWQPDEIELLVFVSQSRDYILPNTAHIIHKRLGLSKKCIVFDIPLGCSGYTYGLYIAASLTQLGQYKKVLLLAGETASYVISDRDKTTASLFGDAGTATALFYDENATTNMYFNLQSDGNGFDSLWVKENGFRCANTQLEKIFIRKGIERAGQHLIIDGVRVFEFSIAEVAQNIFDLADNYKTNFIELADFFVMHQANFLINETIRKQLRIVKEKTLYSIQNFGNTSSASIPLTLVTNAVNVNYKNSKNLLLTGFGTGLSWASTFIENSNLHCMPLFEIDNNTALAN